MHWFELIWIVNLFIGFIVAKMTWQTLTVALNIIQLNLIKGSIVSIWRSNGSIVAKENKWQEWIQCWMDQFQWFNQTNTFTLLKNDSLESIVWLKIFLLKKRNFCFSWNKLMHSFMKKICQENAKMFVVCCKNKCLMMKFSRILF